MFKAGLVDIGNGGYRENPFAPLKAFADPPLAARSLCGQAAENSPSPMEAGVSGAAGSRRAQPLPRSVIAAATADLPRAAPAPSQDRAELRALLAYASELTATHRHRVLSFLDDFGEILTEQAGCNSLVQHCIDTGEA